MVDSVGLVPIAKAKDMVKGSRLKYNLNDNANLNGKPGTKG